jgi:hypothetical protein
MNFKKKISKLSIEYEDGTTFLHEGGVHNASSNWRTNKGKIYAEWEEHVITFHKEPVVPEYLKVAVPKKEEIAPEEKKLDADELRKNPLFAGIADNKVFYRKPPVEWEDFFGEWITKPNGHS